MLMATFLEMEQCHLDISFVQITTQILLKIAFSTLVIPIHIKIIQQEQKKQRPYLLDHTIYKQLRSKWNQ